MKRLNTNPLIICRVFGRNRFFPNNGLPLLIYQAAFILPAETNKAAAVIQRTFLKNNWSNTWRNGIYSFHHFHSNTHECLGICAGEAKVIFGGPGQRSMLVQKGDVCILPAGLGHKCIAASKDFECIGGYPQGKNYDIHHGEEAEFKKALLRTEKIPVPKHDPVFGKEGFLKSYWGNDDT